jgi:hypothetical protein
MRRASSGTGRTLSLTLALPTWGGLMRLEGARLSLMAQMRFVPVKSIEEQDLQSLHRIRERLNRPADLLP